MDNKESLKAVSVDELREQASLTDYLTPREIAKLLGVYPQQVYTWIRKGVLKAERCKCGRHVVCVSTSKKILNKKARDVGKPEPYPLDEDDEKFIIESERVVETMTYKVKDLMQDLQGRDPEADVVIIVTGEPEDPIADGDILELDGDVGVTYGGSLGPNRVGIHAPVEGDAE